MGISFWSTWDKCASKLWKIIIWQKSSSLKLWALYVWIWRLCCWWRIITTRNFENQSKPPNWDQDLIWQTNVLQTQNNQDPPIKIENWDHVLPSIGDLVFGLETKEGTLTSSFKLLLLKVFLKLFGLLSLKLHRNYTLTINSHRFLQGRGWRRRRRGYRRNRLLRRWRLAESRRSRGSSQWTFCLRTSDDEDTWLNRWESERRRSCGRRRRWIKNPDTLNRWSQWHLSLMGWRIVWWVELLVFLAISVWMRYGQVSALCIKRLFVMAFVKWYPFWIIPRAPDSAWKEPNYCFHL